MKKSEFIEEFDLEDDVILLEPWPVFAKGIIGVSYDGSHVIYSYDKLAEALAESYEKDWRAEHPNEEPSEDEDFYTMAVEWLDYNTLRSLPYLDASTRPIINMDCNPDDFSDEWEDDEEPDSKE